MVQRYWKICHINEIDDPGCREFEFDHDGSVVNGFVVHWRGHWYAYRNSCPHTLAPLNWLPDQFFDLMQQNIQCGLHGALFRPEDGFCIHGPCLGRSLRSLGIELRDGEVLLDCEGLETE